MDAIATSRGPAMFNTSRLSRGMWAFRVGDEEEEDQDEGDDGGGSFDAHAATQRIALRPDLVVPY
ncbi:hypothetical protein NKG95_29055 [Mesorhizobium sp. M1423]|uniref:hypothetical protein n=1 Tax=Mesorhizobium sp. M1423 TaxID=2957101 RepID=UPI003336F5B1